MRGVPKGSLSGVKGKPDAKDEIHKEVIPESRFRIRNSHIEVSCGKIFTNDVKIWYNISC